MSLPLLTACMPPGSDFLAERATAFYGAYSRSIVLTAAEREVLFPAAMFWLYAYVDCPYGGDVAVNCRRIEYAIRHQDEIESCVLTAIMKRTAVIRTANQPLAPTACHRA